MGAHPHSPNHSPGHVIDLINGKLKNVASGGDVKFKILKDHIRVDCHIISARAMKFIFEKIFESQPKEDHDRQIAGAEITKTLP